MAAKFTGLRTVEDSISLLLKPISKNNKQNYILISNIAKNWEMIVGHEYSKFCHPKSITFDNYQKNEAKLTIIAYNNSIAFFLKNNSEIIIEKISSIYGHKSIRKIIIKQEPKKITIEERDDLKEEFSLETKDYIEDKIKNVEDLALKETLIKLAKTIIKP